MFKAYKTICNAENILQMFLIEVYYASLAQITLIFI